MFRARRCELRGHEGESAVACARVAYRAEFKSRRVEVPEVERVWQVVCVRKRNAIY